MRHTHSDSNYIESRGNISVVFTRLSIQQVRTPLNVIIFLSLMTAASLKIESFVCYPNMLPSPRERRGKQKLDKKK